MAALPGIGVGLTFSSTDADCASGTGVVCFDTIEAYAVHEIESVADNGGVAVNPTWKTKWYKAGETNFITPGATTDPEYACWDYNLD